MKSSFEQITIGIDASVSVIELNMDRFDGLYHHHPEIELTWIRKSRGKRFVGVHIADYEPDDLVLLGSGIAHCWQSMEAPSPDSAQAVVIQFRSDLAGDTFLKLPELKRVEELLEKARAGILVLGNIRNEIIAKIEKSLTADKLHRVLILIEILNLIATSDEIKHINQSCSGNGKVFSEADRFQHIFGYLIKNFQQEISLDQVAEVANMSPNAFCRYFKSVTKRTLMEVVRELRLNHACLLLRDTEKSVNDICFESGFGNISYFNKAFKRETGYSPLNYRNLFS